MRIGTWFTERITKRLCPVATALSLFVGLSAAMAQTSPQTTPQIAPPTQNQAQPKAQITAVINPAQRKVLGNSVHPLATSANDRGHADPGTQMKDMVLLLHPTQAQSDALKKYIDDLHNPNSANFHKWLTPEQYAAQYGVTDADLKTVSAWLSSSGFSVEQTARGKNWIRFSGTSGQVETAFKTSIHTYSVTPTATSASSSAGATLHYANATQLSIPAALAPAVTGVVSMNNFLSHTVHSPPSTIARNKGGKLVRIADANAAQASIPAPLSAPGTASPNFTSAGDQQQNFIAPNDFAKIYNTLPLVAAGTNGAGTSIAIVGRSDINLSDVEAFRTIAGLPFNDPTITYATTDPGDIEGDDLEASLDVEWSGAVAPQAKIDYVIGASTFTTDGVDISAAYIVDNVVAPIMSLSFSLCEADTSEGELQYHELLWQQAASEGITVLVSAGDAGSSTCNSPDNPVTTTGLGVNGLASTAYNIAVGGTEFQDTDPNTYWNVANDSGQGSAKGYIPEAVWNESCTFRIASSLTNCYFPPYNPYTYATGGGASSCVTQTLDQNGNPACATGYAKPSWQTGPGVPDDQVRDLPDVSLASASEHDPYLLCYQGSCQWETDSSGNIVLDQATTVGGTSAAAPSMAGILALVEQKAGQFQGVANYQLYKLAATQSAASCNASNETDPTQTSACVFNDITTGSNAVPCPAGSPDCAPPQSGSTSAIVKDPITLNFYELSGYNAGVGYDLASGLGSVNAANLVNAWGSSSSLPSTTTLKLSQTTFAHGTPITFSGVVAPASGTGTPTGDVLLNAASSASSASANAPVQTVPVASGAFSASTINLPGGTYTLTADYSGDATYGTSASQPVTVTVSKEDSVATGSTYAYSLFYDQGQQNLQQLGSTPLGRPFWIDVQITGASGSTGATGTVELFNNGTSLGTFPLDHNGSISLPCGPNTVCDLPVGNYNFTAKYSGDNSFNPSTTTVPFNVFKGWLNWQVIPNTQTPIVGSTVAVTVYFNNDPKVIPTGSITISRDDTGQILGTATINKSGTANLTYTATDGTYDLIGTYAGDANYTAISQDQAEQITTTNNGGTSVTKVTITGIPSTTTMGTRTQYSVAVAPTQSSTKTVTGTVTLFNNTQQIAGTVSLSGGKATGFLEWDQVGSQQVYAIYSGDTSFGGSSSSPVTITVSQAQPAVVVQPIATTVAIGAQTSLTAFLTSPLSNSNVLAPTGTIQFWDSINGAKAVVIGNTPAIATGNGGSLIATIAPVLATGSNVITAVYSGDPNWLSATSAASAPIVVTTPSFTDVATPNPLAITAGETAAVSVSTQSILGFSAQIALSCGGTLPEGVSCASATVAPGATGTINLTTVAPGVASATASATNRNPLLAASGVVAFAGLFFLCIPNRRRFHNLSVVLIALGILGGVVGCGGSSGIKATTMVLSSSNTKVASGGSVTLEATVQSHDNLQGTVTFYDGSTAIGSAVQVTNGVATLNTSSLPVGTHAITAKYSGDKDDSASSSSNMIEQTVTGAFTLTINATSGSISQPLSVPATLN